jgi:hypothetical protein
MTDIALLTLFVFGLPCLFILLCQVVGLCQIVAHHIRER